MPLHTAHGSTHVALSTRAESTTSARRLRPLSFCPDSLEGFTAYHRYFEQRNYVTYRTTPPAYHRYFEQRNYVTYRTMHLAHNSTRRVAPHNLSHNTSRQVAPHSLSHNTSRVAPCTLHLAPCTLHLAPHSLSHNTSRVARRNEVL